MSKTWYKLKVTCIACDAVNEMHVGKNFIPKCPTCGKPVTKGRNLNDD